MKLKIFNAENSIKVSTPIISFSKSGAVVLNKVAFDNLSLKIGDKIEIAQDEDSPKEWFIKAKSSDKGFCLREKKDSKSGSLTFNSKILSDKIRGSIGFECSAQMQVSPEKIQMGSEKYYAIITSSAR